MANFVNAEDVRWFEQYILFKSMFNKQMFILDGVTRQRMRPGDDQGLDLLLQ